MAVQGRLVPQDPNDESASVLLERIRAEKQRINKEGKGKKDKNESVIYRAQPVGARFIAPSVETQCFASQRTADGDLTGDEPRFFERTADGAARDITEELPFEVPETWEWARLGTLCNFGYCENVEPDKIAPDAWLLDLEDIEKDTGRVIQRKKKHEVKAISTKHFFTAGQVLYSKLRPYLNKVIIADDDGFCTSEILTLDFGTAVYNRYAQAYLMSPFFVEYVTQCSYGVKMPRLGTQDGRNAFVPLPPIAEQHRIVERIEQLLPHIAEYDDAEQKLTALNDAFPDQLKKSILQAAVQGKLVEQNPNDEPAALLLERIRTEKEQLIKAGKIKKEKPLPPVTEDEIPFGIPESWAWARLGTLCNFGYCENVEPDKIAQDAWLLDLEDIEKDTGRVIQRKKKNEVKSLSTKHFFTAGQVLYSKLRPYLNKVVVADDDGFCTSEILPLDFGTDVYNRYAQIYLMSPYFVDYATQCSYGVKMPRLGTQDGRNALIPLPPLAEQHRIVEKCEELLPLIERCRQ